MPLKTLFASGAATVLLSKPTVQSPVVGSVPLAQVRVKDVPTPSERTISYGAEASPSSSPVQMFGAMQRYRFRPTGESGLNHASPMWQVVGRTEPTENGRVDVAFEKSIFFV